MEEKPLVTIASQKLSFWGGGIWKNWLQYIYKLYLIPPAGPASLSRDIYSYIQRDM